MLTPPSRFPKKLATAAVLTLLLSLGCQRLGQVDIPTTNPNPAVGTLPSPTAGASVGIGTPSPSSTPLPPAGSPTASPVATPTPTPNAATCALPPRPDGSPCKAEAPSFQTQVEAAQAEVFRTRPDLFDSGRVRSEDSYVQEVARVLRTRGLCAAQGGPRDEVAVKNTNDWNDQYDIVLASGEPWTSYQVTCRPARF